MRKTQCILITAAAAGMALSLSAKASTVSWSAAANITNNPNNDINPNGTNVYAYSVGGDPNTYGTSTGILLDGVTFVPVAGSGTYATGSNAGNASEISISGMGTAYASSSPGTPSSSTSLGYYDLLTYDQYGGTTGSIILSGLMNGNSYQVQIWVNDQHGGQDVRTVTLSDASIGGDTVLLDTDAGSTSSGYYGQYAIGSFAAVGSTQTIYFTGGGGSPAGPAELDALSVNLVPEPVSAGLLSAASVGLLLRRRRAGSASHAR